MSKNKDFSTTGNSVWNQPFMEHLEKEYFPNVDPSTLPQEADFFLENYPKWIASSKLNKFTGLDAFDYRFVSLGATQTLDWWHYYCMANGYRLRMFRGEYPYNRDVLLEGDWTQDRYIDDAPLLSGDAVIISVPFSGSGRKPERWQWLMSECNEKNIPVLVDCAWFGTCFDIEVNLDEPCIKMATFSTTKGLSCGNWRAGICFSRIDEGALSVQTEWHHGIHLSVAIANCLMREFSPDTIAKKYRDSHTAVCDHYGFQPTNTVHVAQAPLTDEWNSFSRDGAFNRVNIAKAIKRYKQKESFYE
jgi:hypothetical protein